MVARGELARAQGFRRAVRIPHTELVAKFGPLPSHANDAPSTALDAETTGEASNGTQPTPDELEDPARWVAVNGHLCRHDSAVIADALRRSAAINRAMLDE